MEEFIKRMMRAMNEKDYEIEEVTKALVNCERSINRHAATLVLLCLIKCFKNLEPHIDKVMDLIAHKKYDKVSGNQLKRIYVHASRVYMTDFVLYAALTSND